LDCLRRNDRPEDRACRSLQLGVAVCLLALALSAVAPLLFAASEHHGQVTFGGLPVPGVTVTASQGSKHFVAITDQQGAYTFAGLDDGVWKFQVEMLGFAPQTQDIAIAADAPSPVWELKLLPLEEITRGIPVVNSQSTRASPPTSEGDKAPAAVASPGGFQRTAVNAASNAPPPQAADTAAPANDTSSDLTQRAATGLLVNGSVNNGAASTFAQMAAFGNNRRGPGSLYNGGVGAIFDTSAWDARPFSLTGIRTTKPAYNDVQIVSALGGPFGIPHHLIRASNFFVAYQHAANDDATVQLGRVPTLHERAGNFSQTLNASGQPTRIFNPSTGSPFLGNVIPISPQAQALLSEYPLPNVPATGVYNYQAPVLDANQQNSVQARITKNFGFNQSLFGNFAYQRATTQTTDLFGFQDSAKISGLDSAINWSRRFNRILGAQFFSIHFKYEFSRLGTDLTPYFANRTNVSGAAGILGNDQEPLNWGPPNLVFSSGVAGLSEPEFKRNINQTQAFTYDSLWNRGRHSVAFGGDLRRQQFNIFSQQDARGTFAFTGSATQAIANGLPVAGTGSDLADFLLGIPDTASIDFGNSDKYLRGWIYDAFINDDWRVRSGLTLNVGLRWEYAEPLRELHNRLANLDIAPGFISAATVAGGDPTGAITGQAYPNFLLRPDYRGIEPRVGFAWRPRPASPLVIRAGYGVYDNTSVYQVVASQLATQPPFTKSLSIQNSVASPLTLATAFNTSPSGTPSTFAVDPNFRVGYAQIWDISVQQDLPGSLIMSATYLGTKGTRLMQEYLPNTFPLGATNPCPACPAGFVYLGSNGNSTREAVQVQLRRRLHDGLTATLQYTYSNSMDDASAFSGAGLATGVSLTNPTAAPTSSTSSTSTNNGTTTPVSAAGSSSSSPAPSIAQNWQNLNAERGPSTFDQRHLLNFQIQYTSGEGVRGGALLSGWRGTLLKEWTFTAQLTAGSGLPLTPVYLSNVVGTGVTGTIRPSLTGASIKAAPAGFFINPAAYTAPAPGQWGTAGRDSITGPAQFGLNASIGRTFRLSNRLNADWRMDATNLLNAVTYTAWNTAVTSPLFGLPSQVNTMRKLQTTFRVRF
jgi:hypothetical protein